jgi:hypothetical protein
MVFLAKDRTMDNVQKHNTYTCERCYRENKPNEGKGRLWENRSGNIMK